MGEADCFVIDDKMPAMSGFELANRLRNRHLDTPIILITGYPDQNIEQKAAAAGIRHFCSSPILRKTSSAASGAPSRKARPPGDKRSGGTPVNYLGCSP